MKFRLPVLVLLVLALSLQRSPNIVVKSDQGTFIFRRHLLDNLKLLYNNFEDREFIVCVEGKIEGRIVYMNDFRMPHIRRSTADQVHAVPSCAKTYKRGIIATLHNHPGGDECYLSRVDQRAFSVSGYRLTFVQCAAEQIAWWHRTELDGAAKVHLAPKPDQVVNWEKK